MAVVAYSGLPGHGKSYGVVEHVLLEAFRRGRVVVTNLPLKRDLIEKEFGAVDLRPFDVDAISKSPDLIKSAVPVGAVAVVDEAWRLFPQGMSGNKVPEPFRAFLAEHRHMVDAAGNSQQIVLVTQDLQQLASFARSLIEETFRVRKLSALGMSKSYVVDVYRGAVTGAHPPERLRVRQIPGKYKPSVYRFYESHTKRQGEGSGANESKMDSRGVLWRSPLFWLGGPVLLALFVLGVWKVWGFLHRGVVKPRAAASSAVKAVASGVSSAPWAGGQWRIVGDILERDQVFLFDGARTVTLSFSRYCDRDIAGFIMCTWDGRRISDQVRYIRGPQVPQRSLEVLGSTVAVSQ